MKTISLTLNKNKSTLFMISSLINKIEEKGFDKTDAETNTLHSLLEKAEYISSLIRKETNN